MAGDAASLDDAHGVREGWLRIDAQWSATIERARALPEPMLHARVAGEWSFVETLRHLIFVTDAWVRRTILSAPDAYHRLALPPDGDTDVRPWGIDVAADPPFVDVLTARLDRTATARRIVDELTPEGFARICPPNPAPGFPPQTTVPVGVCLAVVVGEERAHHTYAVRDLDAVARASATGTSPRPDSGGSRGPSR